MPANAPMSENESRTVSVRRIDNGYVTCETHYKGNECTSREEYSPTKPVLTDESRSTPNAGRETMRAAMDELRRK